MKEVRDKMKEARGKRQEARGKLFLHLTSCFLFLASLFLFLAGCSTTPSMQGQEALSSPLLWPPPPEPARIIYEGAIERPDDVGAKKGIFRRAVELLLGKTADRIVKPYGIAIDSNERLIVVDTAFRRLHIFDRNTGKYTWIDEFKKGEFISPIGVAVDSQDNIYVSESELSKVLVFSKKGKFLFEINDSLHRPTGIAINNKEGLLYVVNTGGHNVSVYDMTGKYSYTFGQRGREKGRFNYPTDIHIDKQGFVYVTDSMNFRIQIFDKNGKFLSTFGRHGDGSGSFSRPKGVSMDSDGHIYVVDALFDAVQIFDGEGHFLLGFGSSGQGKGGFWLPSGIFVDSKDRIYVADSFNRRIQIFKYLKEENKLSKETK